MTDQPSLPSMESFAERAIFARKRLPLHKIMEQADTPVARVIRDARICSSIELLAVLIGGSKPLELANALVTGSPYLFEIAKLDYAALTDAGLPPSSAARLKAAVELGKRLSMTSSCEDNRPVVHSPADASSLVMFEMSQLEQEELWTILLDTRNRVTQIVKIYKGSINQSQVRVGELFKQAIRYNATNIIVAHNHPSGDPTPSPDDVTVTRQIIQSGKLLDIEVLDHIVIGGNRFVSLKDRGLGF